MPARRRTGSLHPWLLDGAPVRAPRAQTRHGPDARREHRLLVRRALHVALRVRRRHLRAALVGGVDHWVDPHDPPQAPQGFPVGAPIGLEQGAFSVRGGLPHIPDLGVAGHDASVLCERKQLKQQSHRRGGREPLVRSDRDQTAPSTRPTPYHPHRHHARPPTRPATAPRHSTGQPRPSSRADPSDSRTAPALAIGTTPGNRSARPAGSGRIQRGASRRNHRVTHHPATGRHRGYRGAATGARDRPPPGHRATATPQSASRK